MLKPCWKIYRSFLVLVFVLLFGYSKGQTRRDSIGSGQFSFGMRNTLSAFTDAQSLGLGSGAEVRIRLAKQINTEWFGDYISTNVQNLGYRRDAHIGWSVLFYLNKDPLLAGKLSAYVLAGHCFDYTQVYSDWPGVPVGERWSSAVQGGLGIHYNLTRRFDVSLLSQYMVHFGTNIITSIDYDEASKQNYLSITKGSGLSQEGHLLTTLSVNYMLGYLWGKK